MKCPNCGHENADGAAECAKCQVIFGKLSARKAPPPAEPSPAGRPEPAGGKKNTLPKILLALAVAAVPAWFFLKPAARPAALPAADGTGQPQLTVYADDQRTEAEPSSPAAEVVVPAARQEMWRFEGTVLDLLKETPAEGAALKFYSNSGAETFQAVTDAQGKYSLELKPLESGGYGVFISHPNYGNQHWDAAAAKKSLKERCKMGQGVQFMSPEELTRHVGSPGGLSVYDFTVYPNSLDKLTEQEKEECYRGISGR
ncbi:MAG: hypothetical protein HY550_08020 [Elusimicrobia bacterium]|nr:hypothetical protein [Elusimicrobiota bacterium]